VKASGVQSPSPSLPFDPNPGELGVDRTKATSPSLEVRTGGCCKTLGGAALRGERLIKLGDSWLSLKPIEVRRQKEPWRGTATDAVGPHEGGGGWRRTRNAPTEGAGGQPPALSLLLDSRWPLRVFDERETAQTRR